MEVVKLDYHHFYLTLFLLASGIANCYLLHLFLTIPNNILYLAILNPKCRE